MTAFRDRSNQPPAALTRRSTAPRSTFGLDTLPRHWHVTPLKHAAWINSDVLPESTDPDFELEYVDIGDVNDRGEVVGSEILRFKNAPSRARRTVQHGDTIISTVRTYLRAIHFVDNPPLNRVVSTGFAVLRPRRGVVPEYLWRVVQSAPFVEAVVACSEGVGYPAINPSRLASLKVWLPPETEQRRIVAFLDRETARIDALIEKKQRLIGLLEEKRAALIHRAVTQGLDPSVPTKPSGLPWLGEVPAHWHKHKLGYLVEMISGATPDKGNRAYWEGHIPWVSPKDMKQRLLVESEDHVSESRTPDIGGATH